MLRFIQIAYFMVGIVQFFAVWDGVRLFIGPESFIGSAFAFMGALAVNYIPLLGSGIGVYGAVHAWDWSLLKSLILFFWYAPIAILFIVISSLSERGR